MDETQIRELLQEVDRVPGPHPEVPRHVLRRSRVRIGVNLAVTVAAVVALAAVSLIGVRSLLDASGRPADDPTTTPSPTPSREEELPPTAIDWEGLPGVSIDGDAIVDIRTGEVTALPTGFASLDSPGNYSVAPGGDVLFLEAWSGGYSEDPFTCPDGDDGESPTPVCQIFVANVDGTDLRQLTDIPGGASAEGWSPDGTTIVAVLDTRTGNGSDTDRLVDLVLIDVATGEMTTVASGHAGDFGSPSFGPDGRHILFWRYTDQHSPSDPGPDLFQIPVEGGDVTLVLENGYGARVSPDGRRMVFTKDTTVMTSPRSGHWGGELWLADADGTDPHPFIADDPWSSNASWSPDSSRLAFSKWHFDEQTGLVVNDGVVVFDLTDGEPTYLVRTAGGATGTWLDDDTLLVDVL
jgi:Tol biopolymer transport system component